MRETILEMTECHVNIGEGHIARQREIVANFHSKGMNADVAEKLLLLFDQAQVLHVAHRDRILNLGTQGCQVDWISN